MSQVISSPSSCCTPCEEQVSVSVPGPAGADGVDGTNGNNGANSFCLTAAQFVQPAANANVDVDMEDARWISAGQEIFIENGGYYLVVAVVGNLVTVKNRDYTANANPGIVVPASSLANPSGEKGEAGAAGTGSGDMIGANNLSDITNPVTALNNLGGTTIGKAFFKLANPSVDGFARLDAANTVTARTFAQTRTDLGLVIGTNVQAYDADLTTWAGITPSANAQALVSAATYAAMLVLLGKVLPRYGLLGSAAAVDMNLPNNDTSIGITATTYRIDKVIVVGLGNLLATTAGVFTAAGGGGTTLALDQALAAISASGKFLGLTLEAVTGTDVFTASPLRFRTGTAAGGAVTANVFIFGWDLS